MEFPKIARQLYRQNRIRMVRNTTELPVPILGNIEATTIDLGDALLRAVSPIHVEYLTNMGVRSSMSIAVRQQDELTALIAMHGIEPHFINQKVRRALEDLVSDFEVSLSSLLETEAKLTGSKHTERVEALQKLLTDRQAIEKSWGIFGHFLARSLEADTLVCKSPTKTLVYEDELDPTIVDSLIAWARSSTEAGRSTDSIHEDSQGFVPKHESAAGATFYRVDAERVLIAVRKELIKTQKWGGDQKRPHLPYSGARIEPRKSFETYLERTRFKSASWLQTDLSLVEMAAIGLLAP